MSNFINHRGISALVLLVLLFPTTPALSQTVVPAPWMAEDVGRPSLAGTATHDNQTFVVRGAGKDIAGSADQFHFVHQLLTGDGEIVARVDSLSNTHTWAKAGVMMRESLTASSPHAFALLTGSRGAGFLHRQAEGGGSTFSAASRSRAPRWVKLERRGDTFRSYESPDGVTWQLMRTETIVLPGTLYVGLAVTSHNTSALATAAFSNVLVAERETTPANEPPSLSLTAPGNGATYTAPATMTLAASASDSDGVVTRVDFYAGSTLIASDTSSPYSVAWSGVPAGSYTLTARATDDDGASATCGPVAISVTSTSNQPPSVALTSLSSGATVGTPMFVPLSATASDADGSVTRVDFYVGSTLVGSDTTSPYSITWNLTSVGTYTLTARATDNGGAASTSSAVTITANPTWAAFAPPADHATAVTSYVLEIFNAGDDPTTGSPARSLNIGKPSFVNGEIRVDVSSAVQPLPAGNYFGTVSAVRSTGSTRSTPSSTFAR